MPIKLIIGLKNPGPEYHKTRHNAGAWFIDKLALDYQLTLKKQASLHAEIASLNLSTGGCKIACPTTFMNHSGLATRQLAQFHQVLPEEILVVHDDLDILVGQVKFKHGGGHGGHNGLRDIITHLGSADFYRLRVGIGHPGHRDLVLNYVLGKPSVSDRQAIDEAIIRASASLPAILNGDYDRVNNQLGGFNGI